MHDDISRMMNIRNSNQTQAKKVLCVCSAGMLRSSTLANVLHREFGYNTRAVGVAEYALLPIDRVVVEWADEIVCADTEHISAIQRLQIDGSPTPIYCLGIADIYQWMDPELQQECLDRYAKKEKFRIV